MCPTNSKDRRSSGGSQTSASKSMKSSQSNTKPNIVRDIEVPRCVLGEIRFNLATPLLVRLY